jgi:hypothetical protein
MIAGLNAQTIFEEEIEVPAGFAPQEVVMPPSPLSMQVLFVGGYDIVQTTETYGNPQGRAIAKEWHDFIGWTPDDSGESLGWVTVNHEMIYEDDRIGDGGGMTTFRVKKGVEGDLEIMDQTLEDGRSGQFFNVDFVNTVGETGMNCAGISAPDGRIWTAEEWYRSDNSSIWNGNFRSPGNSWLPQSPAPSAGGYGVRDTFDFTINAPEFPLIDGMTIPKYDNFNYMVEIDPKQAKAIRKQYNWGRAPWEGGSVTEDMSTVYLGIDGVPAPFVKFEAETAGDFTSGTLYVFKHDNEVGDRWIEVPETEDNVFGGLVDYAWSVGATMFMRNEWVAIDHKTGIVYFSETGRDDADLSSSPGTIFNNYTENTNAVVSPHHEALATERGHTGATDETYQDYYGRIMMFNPETEELSVAIEGGPYFDQSPGEASYPDKHLSNPDGLKILEIDDQNYLLICEDLNGTSNGRVPDGISNRLCELFIVDVRNLPAEANDLIRISAVPAGAEVTGAIQIDDNTILMNSQHPNSNNPFPWNHSLTLAIHGFANVTTDVLQPPVFEENSLSIFPNPTTREVHLSEPVDFAIYNNNGQRVKVFRNKQQANVSDLTPGTYYIKTVDHGTYRFIVQ